VVRQLVQLAEDGGDVGLVARQLGAVDEDRDVVEAQARVVADELPDLVADDLELAGGAGAGEDAEAAVGGQARPGRGLGVADPVEDVVLQLVQQRRRRLVRFGGRIVERIDEAVGEVAVAEAVEGAEGVAPRLAPERQRRVLLVR
jgi:hypothetical protein